jgi:hypothetical protein
MTTTTKPQGAIEAFLSRGLDTPVMAGGQMGSGGWKQITCESHPEIAGIGVYVDYFGGVWMLQSDLDKVRAAGLPKHPRDEWSFDDCTRGWVPCYPLDLK